MVLSIIKFGVNGLKRIRGLGHRVMDDRTRPCHENMTLLIYLQNAALFILAPPSEPSTHPALLSFLKVGFFFFLFANLALRHQRCLAEERLQTAPLSDVQCERKHPWRSPVCGVRHAKTCGRWSDETSLSEVSMKSFQDISQWHLANKSHKGRTRSPLAL